MRQRYTFGLNLHRDADLVEWLNSMDEGERSFYIRHALRQAREAVTNPLMMAPVTATREAPRRPERPVYHPVSTAPEPPRKPTSEIEDRLDKFAQNF